MKRMHMMIALTALALAACGEVTILHDSDLPVPPAATQEQTITGAVAPFEAKPIELGVRYRVLMDAANPALKKQYFKLRLDGTAPIEQRLKVVNNRPNHVAFSGRCTPYARNGANQYALSTIKLGGAWKAAGEGGEQQRKIDVFSGADTIFEIVADEGAGYFEIDLEKYY